MKRLKGLQPLVYKNTRVLILGSFPGRLSLQKKQYYANPANDFWKIMSLLFPEIPGDYDGRILCLKRRKIGLWDVADSCLRPGSSDSAIRECRVNNIRLLLKKHPNIAAIYLNGSTAGRIFRSSFPDIAGRFLVTVLPSSSPRFANLFP